VHSVRLERLGEGLVLHSCDAIAAHLGEVLAIEASASRSLDVAPGNLDTAFGMEDNVHALAGKPCLGF
jgi:hypothetical protein